MHFKLSRNILSSYLQHISRKAFYTFYVVSVVKIVFTAEAKRFFVVGTKRMCIVYNNSFFFPTYLPSAFFAVICFFPLPADASSKC